jgi:hypothetical protein
MNHTMKIVEVMFHELSASALAGELSASLGGILGTH